MLKRSSKSDDQKKGIANNNQKVFPMELVGGKDGKVPIIPMKPIILVDTIEDKENPNVSETKLLHDLPLQLSQDINSQTIEQRKFLLDPLDKNQLYGYNYITKEIVMDQVYNQILSEILMNLITALNMSRISIILDNTELATIKFALSNYNNPRKGFEEKGLKQIGNKSIVKNLIRHVFDCNETKYYNFCKEYRTGQPQPKYYDYDDQMKAVIENSNVQIANAIVSDFCFLIDNAINAELASPYIIDSIKKGTCTLYNVLVENFTEVDDTVGRIPINKVPTYLGIFLKRLFRGFMVDFFYNIGLICIGNILTNIEYSYYNLYLVYGNANGITDNNIGFDEDLG